MDAPAALDDGAAHIIVIVAVFFVRGWKRGVVAVPVGLVAFVVSVTAGGALDGALWQINPIPLVTVLALAVYGMYALMMWRKRPAPDICPALSPGGQFSAW